MNSIKILLCAVLIASLAFFAVSCDKETGEDSGTTNVENKEPNDSEGENSTAGSEEDKTDEEDKNTEDTPQEHEHSMSEWGGNTAQCELDGVETRKCTLPDCDYSESRATAALGHKEISHDGKEAECGVSGYEPYVTCERCSYSTYTKIEALEHEDGDEVEENKVAPTCFKSGSCDLVIYCKHCNTELSRKSTVLPSFGGHSLTNYVYNNNATCTANGTETASCDNEGCKFKDTREKARSILDHPWENGFCKVCKTEKYSEGLLFELLPAGNAYTVVGIGTCQDKNIVIPDIYNKLPVVKISANAFKSTEITGVRIPESITEIGNTAFYNCANLASVKYYARNCAGDFYHGMIFGISAETKQGEFSVVIGNTVEEIPQNLFHPFSERHDIADITFEEGSICTKIGKYALGNSNVSTLVIPDSVVTIEGNAFSNSSYLFSLTLGKKVTNIESSAFSNCVKLVEVYNKSSTSGYVHDHNTYTHLNVYTPQSGSSKLYYEGDFVLYKDGDDVILIGYLGSDTEITVPSGTTQIYRNALVKLDVTKIVIPGTVKVICENAFSSCEKLNSLELPCGLDYVGANIISGCDSLELTAYNNALYLGNSENPYLVLVKAVKDDVTECIIHGDTEIIYTNAFKQCITLTEIVIPDSVRVISDSAFYSCQGLEKLTIGTGVKYVGANAFYYCHNLTEINYNASRASTDEYYVTTRNNYYFYRAGQSKDGITLNIGSSVEFIPSGMFESAYRDPMYAPNIKTVIIKENSKLQEIDYEAFGDILKIEYVYYYGSEEDFKKINIDFCNESLKKAEIHFITEE